MTRRNVLMMENDPDDRYIIDNYFINSGYPMNVDFFPGGNREVISYLKDIGNHRIPNLIIMSGKYGLTMLATLKKHPLFRQIPVIVLTELSPHFSINEAYNLGANSVIQKPSTHEATRKTIDAFLNYWFTAVELPVTTVPEEF